MSSSDDDDNTFQKLFEIPSKEIRRATNNFSSETLIKEGESSKLYKGVLYVSNQYRTVVIKSLLKDHVLSGDDASEVGLLAFLNHANIIPFVGCSIDEDERKVFLVTEYAENGSLDNYLRNRDCRPTWKERLKICIGAARGLEYLHSGLPNGVRAIHRDFKTANILLDNNLEAKICGFNFAKVVPTTQPIVYEQAVGTLLYLDPVYHQSGIVRIESDVYSFGVVLFEMLTGMLVYNGNNIDDVHPQTLINLGRYDDGLNKLIDSSVRINMNMLSFEVFKEVAYKCISLKLEERPTMSMIVKSLEEALHIQNHGADSTIITQSQPDQQYRESFQIPYAEIKLAMKIISRESAVYLSSYFEAHRGQLSERWRNQNAVFKRYNHARESMFHHEVEMFHRFNNENVISLIGYCIHNNNFFLVHQYFENKSIFDHLHELDRGLTWEKRLTICVGAARGLKYLHSGLGEHTRVIHGNVTSDMILLDDNWEAKISEFSFSKLVDTNEPQVGGAYEGNPYYRDPLLINSDVVRTESDVYSFGVVLFEVLSGKRAFWKSYNPPQGLVDFVRCCEDEGKLDNMIDPRIRDEITNDSFHVFKKIAYQCISLNPRDRPTMNRILSRLEEALDIQNTGAASTRSQQKESYLIPLEEIKLATNDFSHDTLSGEGGFGKVYKGQLKNCTVAIKNLDIEGHQGNKEFDMELKLISSFRHNNIIRFVGYCNEDNHMIIVTEYANNHSLDHHLQDPRKSSCLTWAHRLKICLGAARGLKYIHSQKVIHRDVKSGNILLDENMEARICDFGLSKENLKNDQQATNIHTKTAGTYTYLDPYYQESGILRSASDVYSFGVVLFEILSGRMAYSIRSLADGKPHPPLMNLIRQYHDDHQLEALVDPSIINQIENRCLVIFKEIAYKCISLIPMERPTMDIIVEKLEDAMDLQLGLNL